MIIFRGKAGSFVPTYARQSACEPNRNNPQERRALPSREHVPLFAEKTRSVEQFVALRIAPKIFANEISP